MKALMNRKDARRYAACFTALADPTRVQLVHWLARQSAPVTVGRVTEAMPVGQSTVSHHLAMLAKVGFVRAEAHGASTRYSFNPDCMSYFPTAVAVIVGSPVASDVMPSDQ